MIQVIKPTLLQGILPTLVVISCGDLCMDWTNFDTIFVGSAARARNENDSYCLAAVTHQGQRPLNEKLLTAAAMQRVFIGIPVDAQSQRTINGLLKPFQTPNPAISWVVESNRHLTLAFLGDTAAKDVKSLCRSFDKAYQREAHFPFKLTALTRFPGATGRIIALTGEPDAPMNGLFGITRNLLETLGIGYDRKAFRPHITLARIRQVKALKTGFDLPVDFSVKVDRITLYQSTFTESGLTYTPLKETQLA